MKLRLLKPVKLSLVLLLLGIKAAGQNPVPCNQITADMGYTVSSVKINARWVSNHLQKQVEQIVGLGRQFNPVNVSDAETVVRDECIKNEGQPEFWLLKGSTSVLYITSQSCDVSTDSLPKQVAVTINPYYLRIDLVNLGNNILPIPRSPSLSFYNQVPTTIKATSPFAMLSTDRQYGPAIGVVTSTDLLHLPGKVTKKVRPNPLSTNLGIVAKKSFNNAWYGVGSQLELNHPVYTDSTLGWNLGIQYSKSLQPWGNGQNEWDHWNIRGGIQGNTKIKLFSKWAIGGGARLSQNRYGMQHNNNPAELEKGLQLYALADGRPGKSFTRMAIWFDAAIPAAENGIQNYQRLVTRIGHSLFLGTGHNSALVETLAGAGYAWGAPPIYNQFFAGNSNHNFLYEPMASIRNQVMQTGPLLRSLGQNEGGITTINGTTVGGSAFWHLNLNFSIPIVSWAKPLIPDVIISEEPRVSTLRSVLKAQAETARNFIYDDMVTNHGYPDTDATDSVATTIVDKDIRPTLNYLADRANIYSIKPVLLFDVSHLTDHNLGGKTFTAAGLGLQMTVVIARLEMGYMLTLSPSAYNSKGNFFLHFVLQNFY